MPCRINREPIAIAPARRDVDLEMMVVAKSEPTAIVIAKSKELIFEKLLSPKIRVYIIRTTKIPTAVRLISIRGGIVI